jgi:hypothetical protein
VTVPPVPLLPRLDVADGDGEDEDEGEAEGLAAA